MDILEFTNDKHKKRYGELLQRHLLNGGKKFDRERFPMFYICLPNGRTLEKIKTYN